jgi:hypothetical protein
LLFNLFLRKPKNIQRIVQVSYNECDIFAFRAYTFGALPEVPRHPVGALALLIAVTGVRAAGRAVAAPLEVLYLAYGLFGQAG